jgi:predicted nucleic acid-binding protein
MGTLMNHDVPYLLVDTNVWISSYLPLRPGHDEAMEFFATARRYGAKLVYAATSIRDVFYICGRTLKEQARDADGALDQEDAQGIQKICWGIVDNMRDMGTAVGVDEADVWQAAKLRNLHGDLEDNFVRVAAARAKADVIVTWDRGLLAKAISATLTPGDARSWLEATCG